MARETRIEYGGKTYTIALDEGRTIAGDDSTGAGRSRWHVTLGPTAVTSFDAEPGESEDSVRERARRILGTLPDLTDRDQIHLGGG